MSLAKARSIRKSSSPPNLFGLLRLPAGLGQRRDTRRVVQGARGDHAGNAAGGAVERGASLALWGGFDLGEDRGEQPVRVGDAPRPHGRAAGCSCRWVVGATTTGAAVGLTPLFWSNVALHGTFELDLDKRLDYDLGAEEPTPVLP